MIFLSLDFFGCGECGGMISAQWATENLAVAIAIIGARKARPLFASVFARKRLTRQIVHGFKHNLALRSLYQLDVGQSENVGARGNWNVAARFKIFPMESKRTRSAWKTALGISLMVMCQKKYISNEKIFSCASRRFEGTNERFERGRNNWVEPLAGMDFRYETSRFFVLLL